jgi:hypothetical protein
MYTDGSVKETLAFINGYSYGSETPISGKIFNRFVCVRNSFPDNYVWTHVINTCSKDENGALQMIESIIAEFLELKEKMSDDELIQYAIEQLGEEGEAERTFRNFNTALLLGNELVIRQSIDQHKDAEVLWKETYPKGVAIQMNELSSGQRIKKIPISADGKKIEIIAQGWPFPIEMNFTNGQWKINADQIIALRMSK